MSATAESFLPLKPAHFHILLSLAARATHGYGVRQAVEERTRTRRIASDRMKDVKTSLLS